MSVYFIQHAFTTALNPRSDIVDLAERGQPLHPAFKLRHVKLDLVVGRQGRTEGVIELFRRFEVEERAKLAVALLATSDPSKTAHAALFLALHV